MLRFACYSSVLLRSYVPQLRASHWFHLTVVYTEAAAPPPSSYDISGRHKQQEDRALLIAKAAKRDIVVAGHSLQMTNTSNLSNGKKMAGNSFT